MSNNHNSPYMNIGLLGYKNLCSVLTIFTINFSIKAGSQNDASLALCQLRCDKILKTDWSNATQLTQR